MGNALKWGRMAASGFLIGITVYFIADLFLNFHSDLTQTVTKITFAVIGVGVLLCLIDLLHFILSDAVSGVGVPSKGVRGLKIACVVVFFLYAGCFVFQSIVLERGSDLYMQMLLPGILPMISDIFLFSFKR